MRIRNLTNKTIYLPSRNISILPKHEYILPVEVLNTFISSYDGFCELDFSDTSNIVVRQLGDMCATKDIDGVLNITVATSDNKSTMCNPTSEESKAVNDYIESLSTPTGITFDDATDNVIYADVLGAKYKIIKGNMVDYPQLERMAGYCDFNIHTIVVDEFKNPDQDATADMDAYKKKVLRHELVHAFLRESGLSTNSWADNEEIVDWIAIQAPKIFDVFKDLDLI